MATATLKQLLTAYQRSSWHLEMRYTLNDPDLSAWQSGLRHHEDGAARMLNNKIAQFRTPSTRTDGNLLIRTRIDTYAQALAARCDLDAELAFDLADLLPWEPEAMRCRKRRNSARDPEL
ncbi:hypothetical protein [Streptosporangium sp. OZ121]|uniref:hypothetical protein n=1 Tax=Streptosporangium sp. OZ121 TaxID=3444183 RepID=UPI003F79C133